MDKTIKPFCLINNFYQQFKLLLTQRMVKHRCKFQWRF